MSDQRREVRCQLGPYRRAHGWSQGEIARYLKVSRSMVSKYERGLVPLRLDQIVALLRLFHCRFEELFSLTRGRN